MNQSGMMLDGPVVLRWLNVWISNVKVDWLDLKVDLLTLNPKKNTISGLLCHKHTPLIYVKEGMLHYPRKLKTQFSLQKWTFLHNSHLFCDNERTICLISETVTLSQETQHKHCLITLLSSIVQRLSKLHITSILNYTFAIIMVKMMKRIKYIIEVIMIKSNCK